jgi:hypothetical protein
MRNDAVSRSGGEHAVRGARETDGKAKRLTQPLVKDAEVALVAEAYSLQQTCVK